MLGVDTRENSLLVDSSLKLNVPEEGSHVHYIPPEGFSVMSSLVKLTIQNHTGKSQIDFNCCEVAPYMS